MNRRGFLTGLTAALAAPVVIGSGVLMPLRGVLMPLPVSAHRWLAAYLPGSDELFARADFHYGRELVMPPSDRGVFPLSKATIASLESRFADALRETDSRARAAPYSQWNLTARLEVGDQVIMRAA